MNIRQHARGLAAALVLGSVILGLSTGQAEAKPKKPVDTGVRCAITRSNGHVDFYLEGDVERDQYGHWKYCGSDGQWHAFARTDTDTTYHGPGGGGGVLAQ